MDWNFKKIYYLLKLIGSKFENNINTFYSKINYLPDIKHEIEVYSSKYESILPYSLKEIALSIYTHDNLYESDSNVKYIKSDILFDD